MWCLSAALQIRKELRSAKLYVDCDVSDRKMQKKVREAQLAQYNYILVVGEQEKVRDWLMDADVHCDSSLTGFTGEAWYC